MSVRERPGISGSAGGENLQIFQALGEEFLAPSACIGCVVLSAKKAAVARGLTVVMRQGEQQFFPPTHIGEAKDELARRAEDAASGACKFIVRQACWRLEENAEE